MTSIQDVTGRQLPWLQSLHKSLEMIGSHNRTTPARTYYGSSEKLEKYGNAGRCSRSWEESEMGLQRKVGAGI